jgi:hypothetical protein
MRVSIQTVTDYNEIMLINKDLPEGTSQITELEIKTQRIAGPAALEADQRQ